MDKYIQSELTDGAEPFCNGGKRNVADTQNLFINGSETRYRWNDLKKKVSEPGRVGGESIARMLPGERWKGFPSVSPVHRGNDGLPFDVDSLTISFAKWRNESLKAYGNAIVPQVMYRIFQCIDRV